MKLTAAEEKTADGEEAHALFVFPRGLRTEQRKGSIMATT
jgi:hypothetical protein